MKTNALVFVFLFLFVLVPLVSADASFTGTPLSGCTPLSVQFTDESPGTIVSWSWDFGDGGSGYLNPYAGVSGYTRYQTQLHSHTTNSDGLNTPAEVTSAYEALWYDALAITDHDYVTTQPASSMVAIEGNELGISRELLSLFSNYTKPVGYMPIQDAIDAVNAVGGVSVFPHPFFYEPDPYPNLSALTGFTGIEIHNAGEPSTCNVSLWDQLLTNISPYIYGFSDYDSHSIPSAGRGRIYVFAHEKTESAIKESIENGRFVAAVNTTNTTFGVPEISGNVLSVTCINATSIRFVGANGTVLETDAGDTGSYTILGTEKYVRCEVVQGSDIVGYYQPIVLESTLQNPIYVYNNAGTYYVNLTVTDDLGVSTYMNRTAYITGTYTSEFSANVTQGIPPLVVAFTDSSCNTSTGWYWEFGDGDTGTTQTPTHTYDSVIENSITTFNVNFNTTNGFDYDWENKTAYITLYPQ